MNEKALLGAPPFHVGICFRPMGSFAGLGFLAGDWRKVESQMQASSRQCPDLEVSKTGAP